MSICARRPAPPDTQWPLKLDRSVCPALAEACGAIDLLRSEMRYGAH